MDVPTENTDRQPDSGSPDPNSSLSMITSPLEAHRIQQLRSMILAIIDEPIEDESSNDRFLGLPDRRILASVLEPRLLQ